MKSCLPLSFIILTLTLCSCTLSTDLNPEYSTRDIAGVWYQIECQVEVKSKAADLNKSIQKRFMESQRIKKLTLYPTGIVEILYLDTPDVKPIKGKFYFYKNKLTFDFENAVTDLDLCLSSDVFLVSKDRLDLECDITHALPSFIDPTVDRISANDIHSVKLVTLYYGKSVYDRLKHYDEANKKRGRL